MSKSILSDCIARAALIAVYNNNRDYNSTSNKCYFATWNSEHLYSLISTSDAEAACELRKAVRHAVEKVLANYNHTDTENQLMP